MFKKKLLNPILGLSIATCGFSCLGTVSCSKAGKFIDYSKATWSFIAKHSNTCSEFVSSMLEELFDGTEEEALQYLNTEFIPSERNVKAVELPLFGNVYQAKVKLIGVNQDKFTDSTKTKTCFTFEFQECITFNAFDLENNLWHGKDEEGKEKSSNLREFCNSTLYEMLPNELKNNIMPVNKITLDRGATEVSTSSELLFPLSASEMGYKSPEQEKGAATYTYWTVMGNDRQKAFIGTEEKERQDKALCYWLRSADMSSESKAYKVTTTGTIITESIRTGCMIAPAFCL